VSAIHLRRRMVEAALVGGVAAAVVLGLPAPTRVGAQGQQSSEAARKAEQAAADEDAPGPLQPIPFSHALHAGQYQIDCLYCHSGSERSAAAGVPSVELCMGCHSQFGQDLESVKLLKQHYDEQKPILWEQVHRLPEHVQFRHNRHVAKGIPCQRCHGPVEEMDKVYLTSDTIWWPWLLPSKKLEMGWCIDCHRQNEASQDCLTCHQ
jgi:hypothetical protein